MHVPAVGVAVKNPIALDIPNSPVVLGLISQLPVSILNYKYSEEYPETLTPLLTHFEAVASQEITCPCVFGFVISVSLRSSKLVPVFTTVLTIFVFTG